MHLRSQRLAVAAAVGGLDDQIAAPGVEPQRARGERAGQGGPVLGDERAGHGQGGGVGAEHARMESVGHGQDHRWIARAEDGPGIAGGQEEGVVRFRRRPIGRADRGRLLAGQGPHHEQRRTRARGRIWPRTVSWKL